MGARRARQGPCLRFQIFQGVTHFALFLPFRCARAAAVTYKVAVEARLRFSAGGIIVCHLDESTFQDARLWDVCVQLVCSRIRAERESSRHFYLARPGKDHACVSKFSKGLRILLCSSLSAVHERQPSLVK